MFNFFKSPLVWLVGGVLLSLAGATYYLHGQLQQTAADLATAEQSNERLELRVEEANAQLAGAKAELERQQRIVTERDQRNQTLTGELTDLQARLRLLAQTSRSNDNEEPEPSTTTRDTRVSGLPTQRCSFYDVPVPGAVIDLMRDAARAARTGGDPDPLPTGSPDPTVPRS